MTKIKEDKETERFYSLSYFVIPIPMILGIIFAVYVLITEDSRNLSYCVVAKTTSSYQHQTLTESDFISHQAITLDLCKDKDSALDHSDGRTDGLVRWFVCGGTVCGKAWEKHLAQP